MIKIPEILEEKAAVLEQYYEKNYPDLAPLARQCFLNTIQTTVKQLQDDSYFVITGDIPAMWLRDSAAQVRHYLRFAKADPALSNIIGGVVRQQVKFVNLDPYANAFNESANGMGHQDDTELHPHVWERKYEVDSLCAPLYLSYEYWKTTGNTDVFDNNYLEMLGNVIRIFTIEQQHEASSYYFQRHDCAKTDTLVNKGKGRPVNATGMTWSGFRPSDDCCKFGYLIPANMMAVVALGYGEEICREVFMNEEYAEQCRVLKDEIKDGIDDYGIVKHPVYGEIYAYETDGYGNYNIMDDANSPSLLAMPYLHYCDLSDIRYQNTRSFVLSEDNPYYHSGTHASGVGSPHTPEGMIWHIGIVMRALTSNNDEEIKACLGMLARTHAGTNFMHEAFDPNDPANYTRSWFAWANSLFADLLLVLMERDFFA
jgi:meiotically up-regulated gene 157 (Mug157) protein